jgi:hypothetical protein
MTPEEKAAFIAEMKTAHRAYDGPVTVVPMGRRNTKSKKHKHIGGYDKHTRTYVAKQSAMWDGGGHVDVESLS